MEHKDAVQNGRLLAAIKTGDVQVVKQFFSATGPHDVNTDISGYGTGRNALSYASEHGQTTVVSTGMNTLKTCLQGTKSDYFTPI